MLSLNVWVLRVATFSRFVLRAHDRFLEIIDTCVRDDWYSGLIHLFG